MEKKYTMKEFEQIFVEAQMQAMDQLMKEFRKSEKVDDSLMFIFNVQNMTAMAELYKNIFHKKEK